MGKWDEFYSDKIYRSIAIIQKRYNESVVAKNEVGDRERMWSRGIFKRSDTPECQNIKKIVILDLYQISVLNEEIDGYSTSQGKKYRRRREDVY